MAHLVHHCGWIIDEAPPTGSMTVFVHLRSTTHACAKLDVILFAVARIVLPVGRLQIRFSPIGESTVLPIAHVVDRNVVSQTVALTTAVRLSDNEQLEVLRQLDQFRQWHSLEEKRYCLVCGKLITGRQIQVAGGSRGNGPMRLNCPTGDCNSIPMDWVLPTNEILAKVEKLAEEEHRASALRPTAANGSDASVHTNKDHEHFVSRLRRLAFHLRRHS